MQKDQTKIMEILREKNINFEYIIDTIFKDDILLGKTKRLIAIASAVATGCDFCFEHHKKIAETEGVSNEEIEEAVLV
ncbi:carboxymuconolactone decarboxylase family protein [Candidatus Methanoliparum sp. LAM-1]|nr:carboxymuconolactone decarboxylase family protein [Candidatus Methanoliparum sp. LAM-1]BDC35452.1 hypothetical protein MTLP_01340 [Candidatus Methanoliparum sp. LAM-1]